MTATEGSLVGRSLSHYEILEEIGRGGMGVIYRARDTELRRDVAIKVLPETFVADEERLARFEREARVLAALNHPGIATIHELGRDGSTHFLVMELVPGEDLAKKLSRGALSLEDVLKLFPKIAEALEAAHGQGVIHRDLKPANVRLAPDGRVKLLDFGLAKPVETSAEQDPSLSPTLTREGTATGVILGTASYMSPEQALGKTVDKRADVWAFGCVLYEALSGQKAFPGQTVVETLASVLRREPDWSALPNGTPTALRTLLRRCLRTDPDRRLHDVADARIEIEEATAGSEVLVEESKRRKFVWLFAPLAAGLVAAFLAGFLRSPAKPPVLRLSIVAPEGTELPRADIPVVSPDGQEVAFVARDASGENRLWIRPLDSFSSRLLPGTEGAIYPFWSPDGRKLGFFAKGKLRTTDRNGGGLLDLADVELARGGTWSPEGTILFAPGRGTALFRVSAAGGPVLAVTAHEPAGGSHRSPQFLPDGRRFIFRCSCGERNGIYVGSLDSEELRWIGPWVRAQFVPPGTLVFVSEQGWLVAQRFDPIEAKLHGEPIPLREDPDRHWDTGWFSLSENGVLVYARDELFSPDRRLAWYDRAGRRLGSMGAPGTYASPELSPDDRFVAFGWSEPASDAARPDIWIHDLTKDAPFRLLARDGYDRAAVWSPDGGEIAFQGSEPRGLYRARVGSDEEPELLVAHEDSLAIASYWTDRWLVYFRQSEERRRALDIWALPMSPTSDRSPGQPRPIVETDGIEGNAQVSPDGAWMAFHSTLAGAGPEIYVQRFPEDTRRNRVSRSGGIQPRWRGDGKELFFLTPEGALMAVDVELGREFRHGEPRVLFQTEVDTDTFTMMRNHYDAISDGERFIVVERSEEAAIRELHVVVNWTSLLRE